MEHWSVDPPTEYTAIPKSELTALRKQLDERDKEIERLKAVKIEMEVRVASLRSRITGMISIYANWLCDQLDAIYQEGK